MATNPMQRKARNSFLLGMVITLLIAAVIIFLLWRQMQKINEQLQAEIAQKSTVYVLNRDVTSGTELTADMFEQREVSNTGVPTDATSIATVEGTPIAKVDLKANTVLTSSMITAQENPTTDDVRTQTYNMISLPIDLETGEYVDIRLMLPNGTDFIVLSKIQVTIPDVAGVPIADTIKVNLSESELLTMSSAIVEAYKIEGSKLYAIKYAEAGNQKAATITYEPRADIVTLIKNDPNVVDKAATALYNNITSQYREKQINKYYDSGEEDTVKSGIQESTEADKQAREEYLTSLYGDVQ